MVPVPGTLSSWKVGGDLLSRVGKTSITLTVSRKYLAIFPNNTGTKMWRTKNWILNFFATTARAFSCGKLQQPTARFRLELVDPCSCRHLFFLDAVDTSLVELLSGASLGTFRWIVWSCWKQPLKMVFQKMYGTLFRLVQNVLQDFLLRIPALSENKSRKSNHAKKKTGVQGLE